MNKKKKGIVETVILVLAAMIAVSAALLLFLFYTKTGRRFTSKVVAGYLHGAVKYVSGGKSDAQETDKRTEEETEKFDETGGEAFGEKKYYHVLFLGEEAIRSTPGAGRTDAILLVTIHTERKKVFVTSILRDTYVEPEGESPCKINAVYAKCGVNGLYDILEEKLGIRPDGYVKVGFDSFEAIIDMLGGAEVTLTAEEAAYLNTHDYISKEEYRNVEAGTHVLNGNQTLGYCRIRYVANCNGTKYDYGRTERQRMVLGNLFERYKEAGITKWVKVLKETLGYIETDISEQTLEELIFVVYDKKIREMEQSQLPAKNTFASPEKIGNVTSPLDADWEKNKELFWNMLK